MKSHTPAQASITEQAAEWLVELAESGRGGAAGFDDGQRREFMSWLKRSPQHIEEFLALAVLEQELGERAAPLADIIAELKSAGPVPPESLYAAAPATPSPRPRESTRAPRRDTSRPARRRRILGWAAAASAAAAVVVLVQFLAPDATPERHATSLGEQRSVALEDGSVLTLNTLSEVDIRIGRSQRHAALVAGEAMFDIARDPRRPFVVEAGSVTLTVLGTKFSVYRTGALTRLAVVEGAVQVVPNDGLAAPLVVHAGEGLVAGSGGLIPIEAGPEFDRALAWTERRLVFNAAPLAEVVNEFNRYNAVPIVVESGELAGREVTTVFKANDVDALVTFLELEPDVYVLRDERAIRIRQRGDNTEGRRKATTRP